MSIQVGINGFGRIGRVIFRTCCETPEIEVAAINDPAIELEYICYLIKFDSTHGKFKGDVSVEGNKIKINGKLIDVFHQKAPSDIPWRDAGVQYVVEASGMFTSLAKATDLAYMCVKFHPDPFSGGTVIEYLPNKHAEVGHLASGGTRRVLVTAPSADVPMLILGVNDDNIRSDMKVISCASSTLYCLAPIVKLLQDAFGVDEGFVTSIHAMTPSLKPLDGLCIRGKHWRDHRSIHQNIIPAATGACKALGRIIPDVRDRLSGLAFRVPIANVSVLDISIRLNKDTSIKEIIQCIEKNNNSPLHNIILVSKEQAVSSDFIGDKHSCILDAHSCLQLKPNFFKLICWYENEYSYACRVIDTILMSERQHYTISVLPAPKLSFVRPRSWKPNTDGTSLPKCKKHVGIECVSFPTMLPARPRPGSRAFKRPVTASGYLSESAQIRHQSPGREKTSFDLSKLCSVKNSIEYIRNSPESQKIQAEHKKTRERLEAVKSEISKMTNMAQNLLKKTNVRRLEPILPTLTSAKEISVIANSIVHSPVIAEQINISETIEKSKRHSATSPTIEICGDFKTFKFSDIRYIRGIKEPIKNNGSEIKLPKPETPTNDDDHTKLEINPLQKTFDNPIPVPKNKYLIDRNILWNKSKQPSPNETHKTKETEKEYAMDTLSKHFERVLIDASANEKESVDTADEVIHIISEDAESGFMPKDKVAQNESRDTLNGKELGIKAKKISNSVLPKTNEAEGMENAVMNKVAEKKSRVLNHIEIIDEKLKKRNIELVDGNLKVEANLKDNKKQIVNKYCKEGFGPTNDKNPRGLNIEPIFIMSEQGSSSVSPVNTVTTVTTASNFDAYRSNQDIYDKLDSASVSGSDDSFLLQGKKSQIINIADLAYSQEDLARLDKICRIIEISDELSDKLFAPLDYLHGGKADGKKWSFKDLCERIKLDEFCNNVFGKSTARVCEEH